MGLEQLLETQLVKFLRGADAVEVRVGYGHARFLIGLDEGEGGARHVELSALAQGG
jgi:hypothetical protein